MGKQLTLRMTWMHCDFNSPYPWILPCKLKLFCLQFKSIRIILMVWLCICTTWLPNSTEDTWHQEFQWVPRRSQWWQNITRDIHNRGGSITTAWVKWHHLNSDLTPNAFSMPMYYFVCLIVSAVCYVFNVLIPLNNVCAFCSWFIQTSLILCLGQKGLSDVQQHSSHRRTQHLCPKYL